MTRIVICRTCPRYVARRPDEPSEGTRLGMAAKALAERNEGPPVMLVNCLSGCYYPCNAAIDAPGKTRLRFSRLTVGDLADLVAVARLHAASPDGEIALENLPESLRDRLSARSPARIVD